MIKFMIAEHAIMNYEIEDNLLKCTGFKDINKYLYCRFAEL